jgi:hypothetical protein
MRCLRPLAFVLIAFVAGCTCGAKPPPTPGDSPSATPTAAAHPVAAGASLDVAVFSAPIAAARASHQDIVAGLVATDSVVRAMGSVHGGASATWRCAPCSETGMGRHRFHAIALCC